MNVLHLNDFRSISYVLAGGQRRMGHGAGVLPLKHLGPVRWSSSPVDLALLSFALLHAALLPLTVYYLRRASPQLYREGTTLHAQRDCVSSSCTS